jgi:hypothetical protein
MKCDNKISNVFRVLVAALALCGIITDTLASDNGTTDPRLSEEWGMKPPSGCYWFCDNEDGCIVGPIKALKGTAIHETKNERDIKVLNSSPWIRQCD